MSSDESKGTTPESSKWRGPGGVTGEDAPGPDGAIKARPVVDDDQTAEGHAIRGSWKATPEEKPGPEGGRSVGKEGVADDEPGPEELGRIKF